MLKAFLRIIWGLNKLPIPQKNYNFLWNFYLAISMGNPALRLMVYNSKTLLSNIKSHAKFEENQS